MTRVGTVIAFRSSVWSVSEKALIPPVVNNSLRRTSLRACCSHKTRPTPYRGKTGADSKRVLCGSRRTLRFRSLRWQTWRRDHSADFLIASESKARIALIPEKDGLLPELLASSRLQETQPHSL